LGQCAGALIRRSHSPSREWPPQELRGAGDKLTPGMGHERGRLAPVDETIDGLKYH
jgi:hypothetical protein